MTDKDRIAQLEARLAQVEARLAQIEQKSQVHFQPVPVTITPSTPWPYRPLEIWCDAVGSSGNQALKGQ